MAKKKIEKPRREFTKRQLSRWQQQERRQRVILGLGVLIIVAVLVTVGVGWYTKEYYPLHRIAIKVNDVEFDVDYYVKMLKLYGKGQSIKDMNAFADDVASIIIRNELLRQGAEKLGISVSDDAVDDKLKSRNPPLTDDYRDEVRSEMLISQLRGKYFDQKVPVFAEQRHIMAIFLESEGRAAEVRAKLERGESFAELAGNLSLDDYTKERKGDLDWKPEGAMAMLLGSSVPEDYAFGSEPGTLSQPRYDEGKTKQVGYWLIKVLDKKEEPKQAHVQAILLGSAEQAKNVRAKLEAGGDFAALAKELSQLEEGKENGGDLGWLSSETMSSAFDEFAFSSDVGTLSQPIPDDTVVTKGGYWLIKVLAKDDNRKIVDEDRNLLKTKALNEWVTSLWVDPESEIDVSYLMSETKEWAIKRAKGG